MKIVEKLFYLLLFFIDSVKINDKIRKKGVANVYSLTNFNYQNFASL